MVSFPILTEMRRAGTEEQGLVPCLSDEDYAEQPAKKKKKVSTQKVMVKPVSYTHLTLPTILRV